MQVNRKWNSIEISVVGQAPFLSDFVFGARGSAYYRHYMGVMASQTVGNSVGFVFNSLFMLNSNDNFKQCITIPLWGVHTVAFPYQKLIIRETFPCRHHGTTLFGLKTRQRSGPSFPEYFSSYLDCLRKLLENISVEQNTGRYIAKLTEAAYDFLDRTVNSNDVTPLTHPTHVRNLYTF